MSYQATILSYVPSWLRRRIAGTVLEGIGLVLDCAEQTAIEGLRASNPLRCKPDALKHIGIERRIRQYPSEPDASYRKRLSEWRQAWKLAGSHRGELMQLQPYFLPVGLPRIRIVHQSGNGLRATWHTIDPDGRYSVYRKTPSNWDWDGVPTKWSRFWVIVYLDDLGLPLPETYDDGATYDDGYLWDGGITLDQCTDLVSIVNDWKAARSILWGLILARDPLSFDPTADAVVLPDGNTTLPVGNWGFSIDNATGWPSRLHTASYPFDLGQG